MKYFVVSDVHGHLSILKASLTNSGFEPNSLNHLLIICGDCFDRGNENKELYEYLNTISNKIIIRGNHEEMLMNAIKRGYINVADMYNGTETTIENFFGSDSIDSRGRINISDYRRKRILDYLSQTVDYHETQNYVFVHGWISEINRVSGDWRNAPLSEWSDARWESWIELFDKYGVINKTIVCGHRASKYASQIDASRESDDCSPYYGKHFIAIDSNTVRSHEINVLVLEDEPLKVNMHSMTLKREFFDKIAKGSKTIELRLFDEKRKCIKNGDLICFSADNLSGETIKAKVLGTYVYPSFEALISDFDPRSMGFAKRKASFICEYMKRFYDDNAIHKNGVVAIKVKMLKQEVL